MRLSILLFICLLSSIVSCFRDDTPGTRFLSHRPRGGRRGTFRLSIILLICLFISLTGNSQNKTGRTKADRNQVLYDPLFWKDRLKLNAIQRKRINEINGQFYQNLKMVYRDAENRSTLQTKVEQCLENRSEQIWDTFHARQKKKWEKIAPL